jgi:protein-S-isoprenylcysteine O-methyltransferase Ste14
VSACVIWLPILPWLGQRMIANKTVTWFVIVLVHVSVTIFFPYLLLSADIGFFTWELGAFRLLGVVPIVVGGVAMVWSGWDLTFAGRGTPAPFDPPTMFVARRLYRFVRNPMYLGDLLVLVGVSLLFESLILSIYALLMFCVFHLFVVVHEEPTLKRKFGESYENYHKVVPRWIPACRPYE